MLNITEFLNKNKEIVKNESKIFSGYKITGIGSKCLKLSNVNNSNVEFINWDEFASNNDKYSIISEIKTYYQPMVDVENEKEIKKATEFVKKNEERIDCLKKAVKGDKTFKDCAVFEDCMTQELCNYRGISQLGRAVIKALEDTEEIEEGEEVEASPKTSTPEEISKRVITKKEIVYMENHLSQIIGEDVCIVLGNFPGTRKADYTLNISGVDFNIYNTGACVVYAYPQNLEFFEKENEYRIRIKNNKKGDDHMAKVYNKWVWYKNGEKPEIGSTIYGTTSNFEFNCQTGEFETCDTRIECKVKEISKDFTNYESERSQYGGKYGYYEWKVIEVLE